VTPAAVGARSTRRRPGHASTARLTRTHRVIIPPHADVRLATV